MALGSVYIAYLPGFSCFVCAMITCNTGIVGATDQIKKVELNLLDLNSNSNKS